MFNRLSLTTGPSALKPFGCR